MTGPPVQFINRMTGLLSTSSMWLMLLGVMTSILSEALAKLTFYPQKIHMDAICDKHFAVNHSIQVAINKIPAKKRFCRVHFKPLSGDWLLGSFTTYSLQMLQPNCTVEALHLSASHEDFFVPEGYCEKKPPPHTFDFRKEAILTLTTLDPNLEDRLHATLLIREIFRKPKGRLGCPTGQFDCQLNDMCIEEGLTCNGLDDCSNKKDETLFCGYINAFYTSIALLMTAAVCLCLLTGYFGRKQYAMKSSFMHYSHHQKAPLSQPRKQEQDAGQEESEVVFKSRASSEM